MSIAKISLLSGAVILISGCQSWHTRNIEDLPPTAAIPETSEPGKVQVYFFDSLDGGDVIDMTSQPQYPDNPDEIGELTQLDLPKDRGGRYGALVRGYIQPPVSGDYTFYVSGDDETQLYLSSSNSPGGAAEIASVPSYSGQYEFDKFSSQTSGPQRLDANSKYYFEVRFKEGGGSDHFTVAWEGPGFTRQIIDGSYLHTYAKTTTVDDSPVSDEGAYSLGYRVGFLDGREGLAFRQEFPPLDQDQDGLYDNWEVVNGLNPNDASDATSDPDGDFLAAADEFLIGTSEGNPDSDNDGIPDGAEFAFEMNPLDATDAALDADSDGYSNLDEYLAGTSPNSAEEVPVVEDVMVAGFTGQYYNGREFDQFFATREDGVIDFDWDKGSPMNGMPSDEFSIRWSGSFTPPHASGAVRYKFIVRTNDGARLYVNGERVVDDWRDARERENHYYTDLNAGEPVTVVMENYEGQGSAFARLTIEDTTTDQQVDLMNTVQSPDPASTSTQDTDSDGIPDSWELRYGLSAYVADASLVNNASGISNLEAYQSGLDPYTLEDVGGGSVIVDPDPDPVPPPDAKTVTVSWTAPGTRTDGQGLSLSEIKSYKIYYGQSAGNLTSSVPASSDLTEKTIEVSETGTWYFAVSVVDTKNNESDKSDVVSADVK